MCRAWCAIRSTIDVGLIGLTAARLSGSGIGIGLQGKGTALIHRRDLAPLANLELFSVAPLLTARMYRDLGRNAARHAKGMAPMPIFTGGTDESISARYHARAVALVALEREACEPGEAADHGGGDAMTDEERFTVEAAVDGKLQLSDLRMDPATLGAPGRRRRRGR